MLSLNLNRSPPSCLIALSYGDVISRLDMRLTVLNIVPNKVATKKDPHGERILNTYRKVKKKNWTILKKALQSAFCSKELYFIRALCRNTCADTLAWQLNISHMFHHFT